MIGFFGTVGLYALQLLDAPAAAEDKYAKIVGFYDAHPEARKPGCPPAVSGPRPRLEDLARDEPMVPHVLDVVGPNGPQRVLCGDAVQKPRSMTDTTGKVFTLRFYQYALVAAILCQAGVLGVFHTGAGKTLAAIAAAWVLCAGPLRLKPGVRLAAGSAPLPATPVCPGGVVVLCPAAIAKQWEERLAAFFGPSETTMGGKKKKKKTKVFGSVEVAGASAAAAAAAAPPVRYTVITFTTLAKQYALVGDSDERVRAVAHEAIRNAFGECLVILDEAHMLSTTIKAKSATSAKGSSFGGINAFVAAQVLRASRRRVVLTATPFSNHVTSFHNLPPFIRGDEMPPKTCTVNTLTVEEWRKLLGPKGIVFHMEPDPAHYAKVQTITHRVPMSQEAQDAYLEAEREGQLNLAAQRYAGSDVYAPQFYLSLRQISNAAEMDSGAVSSKVTKVS